MSGNYDGSSLFHSHIADPALLFTGDLVKIAPLASVSRTRR